MLSSFDTILDHDRQTDRQTDRQLAIAQYVLYIVVHSRNCNFTDLTRNAAPTVTAVCMGCKLPCLEENALMHKWTNVITYILI